MATLIIVRHAQARFGEADYDALSDLGHAQAKLLGRWFEAVGLKPDVCFTGGMRRHEETLNHCLEALGSNLEPVTLNGFREYDHAKLIDAIDPDYRKRVQAQKARGEEIDMVGFFQIYQAALNRWIEGHRDADYDETYIDFASRVSAAAREAASALKGQQTGLVLTSGGPKTALLQALTGVSPKTAFDIGHKFLNTAISRVQVTSGGLHIVAFNAVPHLELWGEPRHFTPI